MEDTLQQPDTSKNDNVSASPQSPQERRPSDEAHPAGAPQDAKTATKEREESLMTEPDYLLTGGVPTFKDLNPGAEVTNSTAKGILVGLGWLDRLLSLFIILAMILGVVLGEFVPNIAEKLNDQHGLRGVAPPLVVGLIVMMWPILTKVQYERLPQLFRTRRLWSQIAISLVLNWILGPFLMLGLAWATLPDLPTYRQGIIMVGIARCIAMVMIWNHLARGDTDTCAILVIINSILQIVLYAPYALLFIDSISDADELTVRYSDIATAVAIYLGIPLAAGAVTRFVVLGLMGRRAFERRFLPFFAPISLIALLYTIIIIFALQARRILHNLGPTFRTFVPLIVYFAIMWSVSYALVWWLSRRYGRKNFGYQMAVVQAFTAGSNNFELAIAVCVAVFGADSDQALAATIGPLVEVPVLLVLSWVAIYIGKRLKWDRISDEDARKVLKDCEKGCR